MGLEKGAFETIQKVQPTLLETIQNLLDLGQSPNQIANKVAKRDVALAGLIELAATYIKEQIENG